MSPPLLSLIVLGFCHFERTTLPCLESLLSWEEDPEVEIMVVDNGSTDDSSAKTAQWCAAHSRIRFLPSDSNRGFAGGMNWGAQQAQGRWLLLVNNDTVFPGGALDALKRVIQAAPSDVAMLGPVTNAAGNGQRLWKPGARHDDWLQIGRWLNTHPSQQLIPTYRCDFFCIAVRRDVLEQLSGLDTVFGLGYYEDFDFSLRLRKAGYRQMITEDVFVLHTGSATFQGSKEARKLIKRNKELLQTKHPDADFEHTRMGNLAVMVAYKELRGRGAWSSELQVREDLRKGALNEDVPRGWLKRWRWQRMVQKSLQHHIPFA